MKAKLVRGAGFRGVLDYVLGKGEAEPVAGTMCGDNARTLAREFGALRRLRPEIAKPVWHVALSLPLGESLNAERWQTVVQDFMTRMGFDDRHAWSGWKHRDTEHEHVHILASRIAADGSIWLGRHDVRRAMETTNALEEAHGLQPTRAYSPETANPRQQPSKAEIELALRTEQQPPRMQLQSAVDAALTDHPSLMGLIDRLEAAGVTVRVNQAATGRISGLSFELAGIALKGSDLGRAYTWKQLQQRIDYDQDRDAQTIAERCAVSRRADEATGRNDNPPRPDAGDGHQSTREPARCDGIRPPASGRAEGSDDDRISRRVSSLEELNRVREKIRSRSVRSTVRATGSGTVARARLAEQQAMAMEIQPRRRPISSGAGRRLADMVAAWPGPSATDGHDRHATARGRHHPEMGSTATTAVQPAVIPQASTPRTSGKERGR